MNRVKQKGIQLLQLSALLLFLLVSTGMPLRFHHCSSANSDDLSLIVPDFTSESAPGTGKTPPCCCSESSPVSPVSFDSPTCCKTESLFLKLTDTTVQQVIDLTGKVMPVKIIGVYLSESAPASNEPEKNILHPPRSQITTSLFGFDRIISLHQIDIDPIA